MIRASGLAIALAAAVAAPAPALADILTPEDATDLAQSLAEAQEEQSICYGWWVFSNTQEFGSSTGGPGRRLTRQLQTCTKGFVELKADINYACESCEGEDSASVSIDSNLPNPPTVDDLEDLGLKADALTGDKDDTTLLNMVNALPLLAADRGNAPYVAYEPAAQVPATDRPTDKPGSDLLRNSWVWLVVFGALILGGPSLYLYKRAQKQT